jgi:hypothetical protein
MYNTGYHFDQCCGSASFWFGSGSFLSNADPDLDPTFQFDPDSDPTTLFSRFGPSNVLKWPSSTFALWCGLGSSFSLWCEFGSSLEKWCGSGSADLTSRNLLLCLYLPHFIYDGCHFCRYSRFWGKRNHLVYVGDSRMRQLYTATRSDCQSRRNFN